jgi:hypothetical protein
MNSNAWSLWTLVSASLIPKTKKKNKQTNKIKLDDHFFRCLKELAEKIYVASAVITLKQLGKRVRKETIEGADCAIV